MKNSTFQIPGAEIIPNSKFKNRSRARILELGAWNFFGTWNLEFGIFATVFFLAVTTVSAQSLWHDEISKPMYADKRASHIGDILTIVVQESSTASKNNQTATSKQSGLDASISSFLYSPAASGLLTKGGKLPAVKLDSKSTFAGGGTIDNKETITAQAAVRVMDVLPNGNLVIEGRRETAFGGEHTTEILRGVVRPEDVLANNTVYSYNVADATIQFVTTGVTTDSQRKGWLHRLWDKFSPF